MRCCLPVRGMVASWPGNFLLRRPALNRWQSSVAMKRRDPLQYCTVADMRARFRMSATVQHYRGSSPGHERPVISLSISATSLYSGSLDKTIKVWDLTTLQCVQTLSEHKAAVTSVLCWDQKLLSCSLDKTVKVWTLSETGSLQVKYTHAEEHVLGQGNHTAIQVQ
uniref:GSVIVT01010638001 n=1 Tax=Arundo donax TaxID=35708 RepID=A0A0A9CNZ4_ARUDO